MSSVSHVVDAGAGESRAGIALVAPPAFAGWMAVIGVSMLRRASESVAGGSDA